MSSSRFTDDEVLTSGDGRGTSSSNNANGRRSSSGAASGGGSGRFGDEVVRQTHYGHYFTSENGPGPFLPYGGLVNSGGFHKFGGTSTENPTTTALAPMSSAAAAYYAATNHGSSHGPNSGTATSSSTSRHPHYASIDGSSSSTSIPQQLAQQLHQQTLAARQKQRASSGTTAKATGSSTSTTGNKFQKSSKTSNNATNQKTGHVVTTTSSSAAEYLRNNAYAAAVAAAANAGYRLPNFNTSKSNNAASHNKNKNNPPSFYNEQPQQQQQHPSSFFHQRQQQQQHLASHYRGDPRTTSGNHTSTSAAVATAAHELAAYLESSHATAQRRAGGRSSSPPVAASNDLPHTRPPFATNSLEAELEARMLRHRYGIGGPAGPPHNPAAASLYGANYPSVHQHYPYHPASAVLSGLAGSSNNHRAAGLAGLAPPYHNGGIDFATLDPYNYTSGRFGMHHQPSSSLPPPFSRFSNHHSAAYPGQATKHPHGIMGVMDERLKTELLQAHQRNAEAVKEKQADGDNQEGVEGTRVKEDEGDDNKDDESAGVSSLSSDDDDEDKPDVSRTNNNTKKATRPKTIIANNKSIPQAALVGTSINPSCKDLSTKQKKKNGAQSNTSTDDTGQKDGLTHNNKEQVETSTDVAIDNNNTAEEKRKLKKQKDGSSKTSNKKRSSKNKEKVPEISPASKEPWATTCVPLALATDQYWLTELWCFLRKEFIEAFGAQEEHLNLPMNGRTKPSYIGQVGLRCKWCKHVNPFVKREQLSLTCPSTLSGVYNGAYQMFKMHFDLCPFIPEHVKKEALLLQSVTPRGGRNEYWVMSAKRLGLMETPYGLFFECDPHSCRTQVEEEELTKLSSNDHAGGIKITSPSKDNPGGGGEEEGNNIQNPNTFGPTTEDGRKGVEVAATSEGNSPMNNSDNAAGADTTTSTVEQQQLLPLAPNSETQQPVVYPKDSNLVSKMVFVAFDNMHLTKLQEADKIGVYRTRESGGPGVACNHCVGISGNGRYFPPTEQSLSQTTTTQTIVNHLKSCVRCPEETRILLKQLMSIDPKKIPKDEKPIHGGRKVFFRRVWCRMQGVDEPGSDNEVFRINAKSPNKGKTKNSPKIKKEKKTKPGRKKESGKNGSSSRTDSLGGNEEDDDKSMESSDSDEFTMSGEDDEENTGSIPNAKNKKRRYSKCGRSSRGRKIRRKQMYGDDSSFSDEYYSEDDNSKKEDDDLPLSSSSYTVGDSTSGSQSSDEEGSFVDENCTSLAVTKMSDGQEGDAPTNGEQHDAKHMFFNGAVKLSTPDDVFFLSDLVSFCRSECFEAFTVPFWLHAEELDGPRHMLIPGQVGIRCVDCAQKFSPGERLDSHAVYYPTCLADFPGLVNDLIKKHLPKCPAMSRDKERTLKALRGYGYRKSSIEQANQFWMDGLKELGMEDWVNDPPNESEPGTVRFVRDPSLPSPASLLLHPPSSSCGDEDANNMEQENHIMSIPVVRKMMLKSQKEEARVAAETTAPETNKEESRNPSENSSQNGEERGDQDVCMDDGEKSNKVVNCDPSGFLVPNSWVAPEDRHLATDFLYFLLYLTQPCKGKHEKKDAGGNVSDQEPLFGLECRWCSNASQSEKRQNATNNNKGSKGDGTSNSSKTSFTTKYKSSCGGFQYPNSSKIFADLTVPNVQQHMLEDCVFCPKEVRASLRFLLHRHDIQNVQERRMKGGKKRAFYEAMWERLQSSGPCSGTASTPVDENLPNSSGEIDVMMMPPPLDACTRNASRSINSETVDATDSLAIILAGLANAKRKSRHKGSSRRKRRREETFHSNSRRTSLVRQKRSKRRGRKSNMSDFSENDDDSEKDDVLSFSDIPAQQEVVLPPLFMPPIEGNATSASTPMNNGRMDKDDELPNGGVSMNALTTDATLTKFCGVEYNDLDINQEVSECENDFVAV